MKVITTKLEGCYIIEPKIFNDERGYFFESFNQQVFFKKTGITTNFVQDNEALSHKGSLRGLHYQKGPYSQAKLVRVVKGRVLDVVVDLRENSKTFGETFEIVISEENKKQLFVPKGFAHGYSVLENNTILHYKCDAYYNPESEAGIHYQDPDLQINWQLNDTDIIVSEKDKKLPFFKELASQSIL